VEKSWKIFREKVWEPCRRDATFAVTDCDLMVRASLVALYVGQGWKKPMVFIIRNLFFSFLWFFMVFGFLGLSLERQK